MIVEFSISLSLFLCLLVFYFGNISCASMVTKLSQLQEEASTSSLLRTMNDINNDENDSDNENENTLNINMKSLSINHPNDKEESSVELKNENEQSFNQNNQIILNTEENVPKKLDNYLQKLKYNSKFIEEKFQNNFKISKNILENGMIQYAGLQYLNGVYHPIVYISASKRPNENGKWDDFAGTLLYAITVLRETFVNNAPVGYEYLKKPTRVILVFDTKGCKSGIPYLQKIGLLKTFFQQNIPINAVAYVYLRDKGLLSVIAPVLNLIPGFKNIAKNCNKRITGMKIESPKTQYDKQYHLQINCK